MQGRKDYQNHDPIVGTNISRLRKEHGMSAVDVVARLQTLGLSITAAVFCHVEKGRNNPSVDLLIALKKIFQCDYNDFFRIAP